MQVAATPVAEEAPTAASGTSASGAAASGAGSAAAADVLTPAEREEHTLVGRALELRYLADPTHNKALAAAVHELLRLNGALHAHEPARHTRTQGLARFAAVVRGAEGPVTSRQAVRELRLPFLGGLGSEDSQCLQFLDQFLQSGRIRRLEEHRGDAQLVAKALFLKLPGAGPHAALQWAQDGHRSLADVQRAALDGSLTGLAELSDLGRAAVACGSALLEPLGMREFEALHTAVRDAAHKVDAALACELTGGYSRRAPGGGPDSSYHDVDVLVKYDDCARCYAGRADTALALLLAHLRRAPGLAVLAEQIAGVDGNGLQAMRKEWAHICNNTPVGAANIDQYRKARSALRLQRSSSNCAEAALAASWNAHRPFSCCSWTVCRRAAWTSCLCRPASTRLQYWAGRARASSSAGSGSMCVWPVFFVLRRTHWLGFTPRLRLLRRARTSMLTPTRVPPQAKGQKPSLRLTNHCIFVDNRCEPQGVVCVLSRSGTHVPLQDDARMAKYIAGDAVDGFIETEEAVFAAIKLAWRPAHERCC